MIGRVIGRYRIVAKLGEGGMGAVWKAEDELLGRTVALKILSDHLWSSEEARQRFQREARAASMLEHPGIATVFDAGIEDDSSYIAFQFVDGETIAQRTARGPMPLPEALRLATGTAEALAHAHHRGVLHRDVTAGNIMVTRDGRAMVVDFGLALPNRDSHLTATGATLGTTPYLPPEVVAGKPADELSDLYSLGVVLYRMVSGRLPFEGDTQGAVCYRILNEDPPRPSSIRGEVPRAVDDMILRLLEKDPSDRFASADSLLEALQAVNRSVTVADPTVGRSSWDRFAATIASGLREMRRRARRLARRRIGIVTIGILTLAAVVAVWAWQRGWVPGVRGDRVLAVLPIRNASADSVETAYLAEGLGEELVTRLGQIKGFRVLPWATTARYANATRPLKEIAKELAASDLLVGSYRSDGDRIRVAVSLVEGKNGLQRWSQVFEEHIADLFSIQRGVTLGVAGQLKAKVTAEDRQHLGVPPSRSPEAYEYFIRGASYVHAPDVETQALAQPFFEKSIELDSTLAEAYVGMGAIHADRYFRGDLGGGNNLEVAEKYLRRALQLDSHLASAEQGLIHVYFERGQFEQALKLAHDASLRSQDDIDALLVQGWGYTLGGLPEKALPALERAISLDPANQAAAWYRVIALAWSDHAEEALEAGKAYVRKFGEDPEIYTWMAVSCQCLKRSDEAQLCYERAIELFGEHSNMYVVNYAINFYKSIGRRDRATELARYWAGILEQRLEAFPDNVRVRWILTGLYAALGRRDDLRRVTEPFLVSRPAAVVGGGDELVGAIAAIGSSGETELALRMVRLFRATRDLHAGWSLTHGCLHNLYFGEMATSLSSNPEFQTFLHDVDARTSYFRSRY